MILRTAAAAALLCLLAAAPARAESLSNWKIPQMHAVLTDLGATVTAEGVEENDPYLDGTAESGLKFVVFGTACDGEGAARACRGAELLATFTMDSDEAVAAKVKELDYVAVSILPGDDKDVKVIRYIIFDHGIDRENLKTNISVFLDIADTIWEGM